jgi:hypothetical protein
MNNFIENKVLENTNFRTNTIGPLAYLVHKLNGVGSYQMEIYNGDKIIHTSEIICSGETNGTSENIDLSKIYSKSGLTNKFRLNDSNAYMLFYNSKEFSSNRIVIRKNSVIEFDSLKPQKGDLFVLNLLKPGEYELSNKSTKKALKINVAYPSLDISKEERRTESNKINSANFKDCSIMPNQGIVIELDDKLNELEIKLLKENLPDKGHSIIEQLKSRVTQLTLQRKKHSKENPIRKIHKEYK